MVENIVVIVYAVGQGMCSLVEGFDDKGKLIFLALMDCGSENTNGSPEIKEQVLADIRAKMERRAVEGGEACKYYLDFLAVSHGDADHHNWIPDLFHGMIRLSSIETYDHKLYRSLCETIEGEFQGMRTISDTRDMQENLEGAFYEYLGWQRASGEGACFLNRSDWLCQYSRMNMDVQYGERRKYTLFGGVFKEKLVSVSPFYSSAIPPECFPGYYIKIKDTAFILQLILPYQWMWEYACEKLEVSVRYQFSTKVLQRTYANSSKKLCPKKNIKGASFESYAELCNYLLDLIGIDIQEIMERYQDISQKELLDSFHLLCNLISRQFEDPLFRCGICEISNYITEQQSENPEVCVIVSVEYGGEYDYLSGEYLNPHVSSERKAALKTPSAFDTFWILNALSAFNICKAKFETEHLFLQGVVAKSFGYTFDFLESLKPCNSANASSLVCAIGKDEKQMVALFPGDVTTESMIHMNEYNIWDGCQPQVMLAPHHGSISTSAFYYASRHEYDDSVINCFLEKIYPQRIVISAAMDSQFGHPQATSAYIYRDYFMRHQIQCEPHYFLYNKTDYGRQTAQERFDFRLGKTSYPIYSSVTASGEDAESLPVYYSHCIWKEGEFWQEPAFAEQDPIGGMRCPVVSDFDMNVEVQPVQNVLEDFAKNQCQRLEYNSNEMIFQPNFVQER